MKDACPNVQFIGPDTNGSLVLKNSKSNQVLCIFKVDSGFDTLSKRLDVMDKFGIDIQILSIGTPGTDVSMLGIPPSVSVRVARKINDSIAKAVATHSSRFSGIAEIPALSPDEALDELERCHSSLGLKGVQLYSNIGGKPLDSPEFRPIFQKAAKLKMPILIHPTNSVQNETRNYELSFNLQMMFGWPFETTLAVSRIVLSGMLDEYPELKIIIHHAGAMLPFFSQRVESFFATGWDEKSGQSKLKKRPTEYFKLLYPDTVVGDNLSALNCTKSVFGLRNMIFATDYPFGPEDGTYNIKTGKKLIKGLDATEEERNIILSGNASKLFRL